MSSGLPQLDSSKASSWVYPKSDSFAIRDYQVDICKHALFLNTLVCLPTGLGKTLIAAVVMYNYYRWFPTGKVIFLAPTKPLVNQQINACHDIMGIPEEDIAHLEGSVVATKRETLWTEKRVFFCTPQTLMNDLTNGRCNPKSIVCIVIDEAHRATGQYAYTTVIQEISMHSVNFRVLALSATPGSDARKVQAVISNLLISHIELRSEDDPELQPYTHQRQIDIVVCEQGAYNGIQAVRKLLNALMEGHVNKLIEFGIVQCDSVNQLNFLHVQEAESAMRTAWVDGVYDAEILHELSTAVDEMATLLRCRKALCDEGLKALLELLYSMKTHHLECVSRGSVQAAHSVVSSDQFVRTVDLIHRAVLDPKYLEKRQPKLNKLKEILSDHFGRHGRAGSSTRALVFSQLRSTVHEIKTEISDAPGIKAHEFVGQGTAKSTSTYTDADPEYSNKGLTQADQARILQSFNAGQYNVLVATSIAEEGLDIAEVDLIVLFESVASPIRLVQRCGRTGRKRSGKVVMLVSQGQEESKVEKSHDNASEIAKTLRHASKNMHMYAHNPVMFPVHRPLPTMVLQDMCVQVFRPSEVAGGMSRNTKNIGTSGASSSSSSSSSSGAGNHNHNNSSRSNTSAGHKAAKPGYSMSAYLGGSTNRSNGNNTIGRRPDMESPEWMSAHSRTTTSSHLYNSNNHRATSSSGTMARQLNTDTNRISLNGMLEVNKLPSELLQHKSIHHDGGAYAEDGEDLWGFNQQADYTILGDYTRYNDDTANTGRSKNVHSNVYNDTSNTATADEADLYGWGTEASTSSAKHTATNSSHGTGAVNTSSSNNTTTAAATNKHTSGKWTCAFASSTDCKKAVEVVDLLDSPLVKSHKNNNAVSSAIAHLVAPVASTSTRIPQANYNGTSTAAAPVPTYDQFIPTTLAASNTTSSTTAAAPAVAVCSAPSRASSNPLPASMSLRANPSFSTNNSSFPAAGVRLTNVVRSSSRTISFAALDDDFSVSSEEGEGKGSAKGTAASQQQGEKCKPDLQRKTFRDSAACPSAVNEDTEGLSDTQSESENEDEDDSAALYKQNTCKRESMLKIKQLTTAEPVSVPVPVPRSQYVDNSGIDWGSSSSSDSEGDNGRKESEEGSCLKQKKRRVPRIKETQECFFSQCSISEEEDCGRYNDNAASVRPRARAYAGINAAFGSKSMPVQLGSPSPQQITAVKKSELTTVSNHRAASDDESESVSSEASDTANACCACLDHVSYEHDVIVFCEGLCGACIHVSCYGVLYDGVPEGDFFCEGCMHTMGISSGTNSSDVRADNKKAKKSHTKHSKSGKATCALCFRAGGLMTLSTTHSFVHPICVLFTPELTFCPETSRADNLASLDKDRKYIKCEVCQEIGGAAVQCAESCCLKAAHPYCAYEARRQMVVRVHNAQDGMTSRQGHPSAGRAYTQQHTQSMHHKQTEESNQGGQYNTYELYCPKHKSLPSTQQQKDTVIATSRLPLREYVCTTSSRSVQNDGRKEKHKQARSSGRADKNEKRDHRRSIGIADQDIYISEDSESEASTPVKNRKGVQLVVKKGGLQSRDSNKVQDLSSPGDLVDTAEKPPRDTKKKRTKSSREAANQHKRRRADPAVARFFELEAVLSGSDSGDDEGGEGMEGECDSDSSGSSESQLSGNFINDGSYTQHSPQGSATQYGMYLAVNNYHSHMRSPDDFVRGKPNVAGLVRRKPLLQSPSDALQDTQASSDASFESIVDTPQQRQRHQPGKLDRLRSASWLNAGTQESDCEGTASSSSSSSGDDSENDSDNVDSELDGERKHDNTCAKKSEFQDKRDPHKPPKCSLMAQLGKPAASTPYDENSSKNKASGKKFSLSSEKENARNNIVASAASSKRKDGGRGTFFNKLALRGLQDGASSDDSDQESKKKHRSMASSAQSASSLHTSIRIPSAATVPLANLATAGGSKLSVAVDLTSSPLCPMSPSAVNKTQSATAPSSPFCWGF